VTREDPPAGQEPGREADEVAREPAARVAAGRRPMSAHLIVVGAGVTGGLLAQLRSPDRQVTPASPRLATSACSASRTFRPAGPPPRRPLPIRWPVPYPGAGHLPEVSSQVLFSRERGGNHAGLDYDHHHSPGRDRPTRIGDRPPDPKHPPPSRP
jgi:hypothetical protein